MLTSHDEQTNQKDCDCWKVESISRFAKFTKDKNKEFQTEEKLSRPLKDELVLVSDDSISG